MTHETRRALVVDDNTANRILGRSMLKKLGWEAEESDNGRAAVEMAASGRFRLILLDISMPGMNGEEACAAIRQLPVGPALHIIAYTAHAFPEEKSRILLAGFDDLVIKPLSIQVLNAALANL